MGERVAAEVTRKGLLKTMGTVQFLIKDVKIMIKMLVCVRNPVYYHSCRW